MLLSHTNAVHKAWYTSMLSHVLSRQLSQSVSALASKPWMLRREPSLVGAKDIA